MGRYSTVIEGLTPAPVENLERQDKINGLKDEIKAEVAEANVPIVAVEYAKRYGKARAQKAQLELLMKDVNEEIEAYEQLLRASCEAKDNGWGMYGAKNNMLRLPNGGSIRIDREPTGKVVDKERYRLWCIANGLEQAMQLWPSRTESIAKERLLAGASTPDGIEMHFWDKIIYTKG